MNTKKILLATLLASTFAPALAAINDDDKAVAPQRSVVINMGELNRNIDMARLDALDGARLSAQLSSLPTRVHSKNIKGAPYSAEMVNEQVQTLADGNQIVTRQSTMNYRDGAGRTRQEVRNTKGDVQIVTINDNVDGSVYMLHPQNKSVVKIEIGKEASKAAQEAAKAGVEAAKAGAEQARQQAREAGKAAAAAARESAAAARESAQAARGERAERAERAERGERLERTTHIERVDGKEVVNVRVEQRNSDPVRIRVEPRVGDLSNIQTNVNMVLADAFNDVRWSHKAVTKDLGSKEIEGVKAEGKLRSYEIPAGEVGNSKPIVVSDESWYAPELQVTVYSKHSDPRTGDRVFRLANLKREEPAAALFTVPSDYTVKDSKAAITRVSVDKK